MKILSGQVGVPMKPELLVLDIFFSFLFSMCCVCAGQQVLSALSAVLVPVFLSHAPPRIYDDDGIRGSNGGDAGPSHVNNWMWRLDLSQQCLSHPEFSFTAVANIPPIVIVQNLISPLTTMINWTGTKQSCSCCACRNSEIGSEGPIST